MDLGALANQNFNQSYVMTDIQPSEGRRHDLLWAKRTWNDSKIRFVTILRKGNLPRILP